MEKLRTAGTLAAAGSATGCILLYWIGYTGGEVLLLKRMPRAKFERIRAAFDRHEFWALVVPSMMPPPFPFKVFALAASVFEMNFWHFLLAIFSGRFVRFLALSLLTIKFGPAIAEISGKFLGQHIFWILGIVLEILAIWWLVRRVKNKRKNSDDTQENQ